jgi:hypothetical protein
MRCPHCRKELVLLPRAIRNVEDYGTPVLVATECCGKPVIVSRRITISITDIETDRKEDDWGVRFK